MNYVIFAVFSIFITAEIFSADGAELFTKYNCQTCHDPVKDQISMGLGPSVQMIKEQYANKVGELVTFLDGKGEPKIYPNRYALMKTQLDTIKGLSVADKTQLAKHLLK